MRNIADLLTEHPFFRGLEPAVVAEAAGCAVNRHFAVGEYLFHEGQSADTFYVVRTGRVALEAYGPSTGPVVVDTAETGDVIGWSWLVPPYRWFLDARAVTPTATVVFDGACLRDKCAADPTVGYAVLQRVTQVMLQRLVAARVQLLDLYGKPHARAR